MGNLCLTAEFLTVALHPSILPSAYLLINTNNKRTVKENSSQTTFVTHCNTYILFIHKHASHTYNQILLVSPLELVGIKP